MSLYPEKQMPLLHQATVKGAKSLADRVHG